MNDIVLHPHPAQALVIKSKARFKVIRAGRKSGKTSVEQETMYFKATTAEIKLGLRKARMTKNRNVLFIAPTQTQARKIIWEKLKTRVGKNGVANEQRLEMKVPTMDGGFSNIYVGGWENRENYRGMTDVVHITFDETDSMRDFFIAWQEIFRPMLLDTGGTADFIGTPKKDNPNLKRLEKEFRDKGEDFASFHFPTSANPFIDPDEIAAAKRDMDVVTYRQEIEAEYVDDAGALFKYEALLDVFTNTVDVRPNHRYLIVDVADDGSDKTVFSFWDDLHEYERLKFEHLSAEIIIGKIREHCAGEHIPLSHVAVDAIGVGSAVASSSLLTGVIGYKSSFAPIKTDLNIALLPNVGYRSEAPLVSDYKNLRTQCIFTLAEKINNHEVASSVEGDKKEAIITELPNYQEITNDNGKRCVTPKEKVAEAIGHSPDDSDTWIMRMYFVIRDAMRPDNDPIVIAATQTQKSQFNQTKRSQVQNSAK